MKTARPVNHGLLRRIKYPDRTTGEPSGDLTDQEAFTYNALRVDRRGTGSDHV